MLFALFACHSQPALQPRGKFVPGDVAGSGRILFIAGREGDVSVEYGIGERTLTSEHVTSADKQLWITGLKVGVPYSFQIVVDGPDGVLRSEVFEATSELPSLPTLTEAPWDPAQTCDSGGFVLFTYAGEGSSGVAIIDRDGDYVWAIEHSDPESAVVRAHLGRDGKSVLWATAPRTVVNGAIGAVYRRSIDGEIQSTTLTRDLHDDFFESPDGQIAWLAYEYSQPNNGATFQLLATDRILTTPEGNDDPLAADLLFGTLLDYTHGVYTMPDEGYGGVSVPGCDEFGHAASLARRDSDGSMFLMWRWLDTMLGLDPLGNVRWEWGGPYSDLEGEDSFVHAHFSEVWDSGVLVFDNRLPDDGPSRLIEYSFDDTHFEQTWQLPLDSYEPGIGDVRRMPDCDHLLVSLPSSGQIAEITREGEIVWGVTVDAPIGRVHYLSNLDDFSADALR